MASGGDRFLEQWLTGWRAVLLAALAAAVVALPGLMAMPVVDRGEAAFAQGSAQMLEQEDYTAIRYQQRLRGGTAPGAHWLQAASVLATSEPEARAIWAWRLPSLFGIMLTAAAAAWGAGDLFGARTQAPAGLMAGCSLLIATLGGMATADALFCGTSALALAGFARLYCGKGRWGSQLLMWAGIIGGCLVEGPMAPALAVLAGAALFAADRSAPWLGRMAWGWGLIAAAACVGPWIVAVTVATDGGFWDPALAPDSGRTWIGAQTLALPLFLFPFTALLPAAAVHAWKARAEPAVRVTLAWLVPSALLFEAAPDKQIYDAAPLYVAIAWLAAAALFEPGIVLARRIGAGLAWLAGLVLAAGCLWLAAKFGAGTDGVLTGIAAILFAAAGGLTGLAVLLDWKRRTLAGAAGLGLLGQMLLTGLLLPGLDPLWPSRNAVYLLIATDLDPRMGRVVGPVASTGYDEPSLVFALGARTQTGSARLAAEAVEAGRPALVEDRQIPAFQEALDSLKVRAQAVGATEGVDYVTGEPVRLTLYRRVRR